MLSTGAFTGRDFFAYGGLVDNAASITCTGMYEAKSDSSVTKNNGTITCNTFEVGTGLQDSAASQYKVTTFFKKGNVSMAGTVIPNNDSW